MPPYIEMFKNQMIHNYRLNSILEKDSFTAASQKNLAGGTGFALIKNQANKLVSLVF